MIITYIKELENDKELLGKIMSKFPHIIQKVYIVIKKVFRICNIVKIEENSKLKILPYTIDALLNKQKWYMKEVVKEKNVILSKKIFLNNELRIENKTSKVFNGKVLFFYLIFEVLKYISEKIEILPEQMNVAIVVSDVEENLEIIYKMSQQVKKLSVVTKKIDKLRKIEYKLYQEKGIAIKISNNKKKSLKKEKIIINLDLNQKELEEYVINRDAILINVKERIAALPKGFSGLSINYLEISSKDTWKLDNFFYSHYYETQIYQKNINEVKEILKQDEVKIKYLIGQRNQIQEQEYRKFRRYN